MHFLSLTKYLPIRIYISYIDIVEQCLDIDDVASGNKYGITLIVIMLTTIYVHIINQYHNILLNNKCG
jgi:hypothetical protein